MILNDPCERVIEPRGLVTHRLSNSVLGVVEGAGGGSGYSKITLRNI